MNPDPASESVMRLMGQRVMLRPAVPDDARAMLGYLADSAVAHFLTHKPLTLAEARSRIPAADKATEPSRFNVLFSLVVEGTVVGEAHAWNIGERNQPASSDPAEAWIGYALNPAYEGRGIASEAVRLLLGWLRARGIRTVYANLYSDNVRSQGLLQKLGFGTVLRVPAEGDGTGKARASLRMALDLTQVVLPVE